MSAVVTIESPSGVYTCVDSYYDRLFSTFALAAVNCSADELVTGDAPPNSEVTLTAGTLFVRTRANAQGKFTFRTAIPKATAVKVRSISGGRAIEVAHRVVKK